MESLKRRRARAFQFSDKEFPPLSGSPEVSPASSTPVDMNSKNMAQSLQDASDRSKEEPDQKYFNNDQEHYSQPDGGKVPTLQKKGDDGSYIARWRKILCMSESPHAQAHVGQTSASKLELTLNLSDVLEALRSSRAELARAACARSEVTSEHRFGLADLFSSKSHEDLLLTHGVEPATLYSDYNARCALFPRFDSPFRSRAARAHEVEFDAPPEYQFHSRIGETLLKSFNLKRHSDETFFYLFYENAGDVRQLMAANELYHRHWRYHKSYSVWIRFPSLYRTEITETYERGSYYVFDYLIWRVVAKVLHIDYSGLEYNPPLIPFPPSL